MRNDHLTGVDFLFRVVEIVLELVVIVVKH